jgi:hypothetical protein
MGDALSFLPIKRARSGTIPQLWTGVSQRPLVLLARPNRGGALDKASISSADNWLSPCGLEPAQPALNGAVSRAIAR